MRAQKKLSKHNVLKQLAVARELYIELRTEPIRERLSEARGRRVHYGQFKKLRRPEYELALARWEAEVKAAELGLQQQLQWAGEAFDLRMQVAIERSEAAE